MSCATVAKIRLERPNEGQSPAKGMFVVHERRCEYSQRHLSSSQPASHLAPCPFIVRRKQRIRAFNKEGCKASTLIPSVIAMGWYIRES
jgi:hypothetical protein